MRKTVLAVSVAAAVAFATSASAQSANYPAEPYGPYFAPAAGAVAGTVVGLGFAEHWWHSPAVLGSAAGAAATGLVAGIGTLVLINAFTTPCHGFRIAIDTCTMPPEAPPPRLHRRG